MEVQLNNLFLSIRKSIFWLIKEKNVDVDVLAFNLGIGREEFINNFNKRNDDFTFYLQTLSLLEKWEA